MREKMTTISCALEKKTFLNGLFGTWKFAWAREVYKEAGIFELWKGIVPTLIMACNPLIQFMIYESSLKHLRAKRASKRSITSMTALEVFLLGALAKLLATVSAYPLLAVKVPLKQSLRWSDMKGCQAFRRA